MEPIHEDEAPVSKPAVEMPGFGEVAGDSPIVILGPNGSGKTKLAQQIARTNEVSSISAQRRTWLDDSLPVQERQQLRKSVQSQINTWRDSPWRPTAEINFVLSTLIQDHTDILTNRNEEAIASGSALAPVSDTKLIVLQGLWNRLFPKRKLEIGGFFPKVRCLDLPDQTPPYKLKEMSDGERTILYMAARVLTADKPVILVDEPELHMHSRLAVSFWDEAEKLRADCRFAYVTHDLHFALSRRSASVFIARSGELAEPISVDQIPSAVAAEVLGAATLPFYARRIILFEGELGTGFANDFFSVWYNEDDAFTVPCGNRDSVCAAVSGLKAVGIVAAELAGLVDRDFYPDSLLDHLPDGVVVLPLHEIESLLCVPGVLKCLAEHLGKDAHVVATSFLERVRKEYGGATLSSVIAQRVRTRVGDLLDGAFAGSQIGDDFGATCTAHTETLASLELPKKTAAMFEEERERLEGALKSGGRDLLALLPGKHLSGILTGLLGLKNREALEHLVVHALDRTPIKQDPALKALGLKLEESLSEYLPARQA
jgi:ABC-type lipoprotein export system ATPase subunit